MSSSSVHHLACSSVTQQDLIEHARSTHSENMIVLTARAIKNSQIDVTRICKSDDWENLTLRIREWAGKAASVKESSGLLVLAHEWAVLTDGSNQRKKLSIWINELAAIAKGVSELENLVDQARKCEKLLVWTKGWQILADNFNRDPLWFKEVSDIFVKVNEWADLVARVNELTEIARKAQAWADDVCNYYSSGTVKDDYCDYIPQPFSESNSNFYSYYAGFTYECFKWPYLVREKFKSR